MTAIAGGIITLEYAAAGLKYDPATVGSGGSYAARDADLTAYVQAATPVIENIVGPVLSVSRTLPFDGGQRLILLNERVQSITSISENGVTLNPATDFYMDSVSRAIYRGTTPNPAGIWAYGFANISITYLAGFATIPMTLQLAARELVRFWVQQGNQSQTPNYGDQVEAGSFTPQGFAVPKRVLELCAPYRNFGGFA